MRQDWDNPDNWKWGAIYYNKNDKRLFVPKRNPNMGVTLNFALPLSFLVLIVIIILPLGIILLIKNSK